MDYKHKKADLKVSGYSVRKDGASWVVVSYGDKEVKQYMSDEFEMMSSKALLSDLNAALADAGSKVSVKRNFTNTALILQLLVGVEIYRVNFNHHGRCVIEILLSNYKRTKFVIEDEILCGSVEFEYSHRLAEYDPMFDKNKRQAVFVLVV
jgi:hypothetical protein